MKPAKSTALSSVKPRDGGAPQPVSEALPLPHERDQDVEMTPECPDPTMQQASRDNQRGLQDTSKGAELDKAYGKLKR